MNYKLTVNTNKEVEVIRQAGSDYVRFTMPEGKVKGILETAESVMPSDRFSGFGIVIGNAELYVAGKMAIEKAADEPVKAEKKPAKKTVTKKK